MNPQVALQTALTRCWDSPKSESAFELLDVANPADKYLQSVSMVFCSLQAAERPPNNVPWGQPRKAIRSVSRLPDSGL